MRRVAFSPVAMSPVGEVEGVRVAVLVYGLLRSPYVGVPIEGPQVFRAAIGGRPSAAVAPLSGEIAVTHLVLQAKVGVTHSNAMSGRADVVPVQGLRVVRISAVMRVGL